MKGSFTHRLLAPIVQLRDGESTTALLMFAYSFLAMTGYNVVKPATRSQFINSLGAANLPYVLLASGLLMGFVIQGYNRAMGLIPRRFVFPVTQLVMVGFLVLFWALFQTQQSWVSVVFYFWGALAGSLLISQFWTLANDIYDPRQAKRIFGFIGGGSSLGGILGAGLAGRLAKPLGTENLLLVGAVFLVLCSFVVWAAVARQPPPEHPRTKADEKGMSLLEAGRLLAQSKHFQLIAMVISFASIGAGIIDQQLNMAVDELIPGKNDRTQFLADVIFYSSIAGFLIQVTLTSRLHRLLGIGFALMILPVSLGSSGILMLLVPALWSSSLARVMDTSLRYTADKTTREILFMPLPTELKYKAKPFADVAVDRLARGVGAALALIIAIKVFHLRWWQLSYLSVPIAALWIFGAIRARREYLETFRKSIETQDMEPGELRMTVADLSTIETLVEELANPDARRVLYAIDILESLEKRNLITPLLLHHESDQVRIRALAALGAARPEIAQRWVPAIQRMLKDSNSDVRTAAVRALASIREANVAELMRPFLEDRDPRVAATAAIVLADSGNDADVHAAEAALKAVAEDTRQAAGAGRREVASAIAQIKNPQFHHLLIPLLYDADVDVAREAVKSARAIGGGDALLVPPLISLLRNRLLKHEAREVLVSFGQDVVDVLAYFMNDPDEDVWVRRHIPGTLALLPSQKAMDLLIAALNDSDGFIRFKALAAIEKLRREHPELKFGREPIEALTLKQGNRFFNHLSLRYNLFKGAPADSLLARALDEKILRSIDRIYRLLGLIYPWKDIAAARWALEHGEGRSKAGAAEYLDNLLSGTLRKHVMPILEDVPAEERVRKAYAFLKSRPRDVEETLAQLIHDDDQVVAAAAIHYVEAKQLWSLADDLEHALAHRDVKDWYVFEAASWALAAHRLPIEKRRALWMEPLPAVELVNRLRKIALFDFLSVDELFRIGGVGRQIRHENGRVLYQQGSTADVLQFLIDGKVAVAALSGPPAEVEAPAALAFEEMLEGVPMAATVRAIEGAICLALTNEEFLTLLSNNSFLAQGLFRMLLSSRAGSVWRSVLTSDESAEIKRLAAGGLSPIEKVLVLQEIPVFGRGTAEQLLSLAGVTRQVELKAGATLFSESDRPSIYTLLSGQLSLQRPNDAAATVVRPGDTVGIFETLGGETAGWRATVTGAGVALRIDRDDLFDLLGDHMGLLQGVFSALLHPAPSATTTA